MPNYTLEVDLHVRNTQLSRTFRLQKAEAQLAYELQEAKEKQKIRNEEISIDIIERKKQIQVCDGHGRNLISPIGSHITHTG